MSDNMTEHEATAKRLLPCFNRKTDNHSCCNSISHDHHCPSYYIPAVAAALAAEYVRELERAKEDSSAIPYHSAFSSWP